ncbi:MAG: hypothetical protein KAW12_16895 [Candidatus Aminicenantes bacterium]|nr:hypothetical protein [Candidatus Aminicenantes bacterium]
MKKKITLMFLLIMFLAGSFTFVMAGAKQNLWIKAAAEKEPATKLQLFEEYKNKYSSKKDKNTKFLYYNLAQVSMILKKFEKVIEYGEQALTFEDLEDHYKMDLSLWLSNAFNLARKDYDKAYSYADIVKDLGTAVKEMSDGRAQSEEMARGIDIRYIGPALRIQIRILTLRGIDDNNARMELIKKAIEAHEHDSSNAFPKRTVFKESFELAKKNKIIEAINSIEKVIDQEKLSYNEAKLLAQLYYRKYSRSKAVEDKDKSIDFYEKAYAKKRKSGMAVKIGQLLSKKDKEKAIQYFAEAYVLLESDKESDAFKYLQQLWYKDKAKDQTPEEQEAGFNEIISAAKSRLGKD